MLSGFAVGDPCTRGPPFPPFRVVENRVRLDVWQLLRAGSLTPGITTTISVQGEPVGYIRAIHATKIQIELAEQTHEVMLVEDLPMPRTPRLFFACPACRKPCRHLYLPEVQCRLCLRLEHAVRHTGRWGNAHRVVALRRELATYQRRRGGYWRLAQQLAEEESRLIAGSRRLTEAAGKEANKCSTRKQ